MARPKLIAKTRLEDGVRVNISDNTVAKPSSIEQQRRLKERGLEEGKSFTPTVISDANIRDNVIPGVKKEAQQLLQPQGTAANPGTQPMGTAGVSSSETQESPDNEYASLYESVMGAKPDQDNIYDAELSLLDQMKATADASTRTYLDSLSATYDARRAQQRAVTNNQKAGAQTLLMSGGGYRSGSGSQVLSGIERAGIRELSTLDAEEQGLKAEALAAQTTNDYKMLGEKLGLMKEKRAEKLATVAAMWQAQVDEKKETQKSINKLAEEAAKNGAPSQILNSIMGSPSLDQAFSAAGSYLQTATGTPGEYLFYKREAEAAGQVPMSYQEYADMDANRKRSIVNVNGGGLTTGQNSSYLRITDKYQADPIIMASEKGKTARAIANQVLADPGNAANQLKSLYVLVKNLDPDSAVREGEIGLAQKTQSYAQTFNNALTRLSKGQVLDPATATLLAESTIELSDAWDESAQRRTARYKSQARNSSPEVGEAFDSYLADFEELSVVDDPIVNEANAQNEVIQYGMQNPDQQEAIKSLAGVIQPELGRAYTWEEIKQILGI